MKIIYNSIYTVLLFLLIAPAAFSSNTIFVANNGNDNNNGTAQLPFATITRALQEVKKLRDDGKLQGNVELKILKGEYRISEPIEITNNIWDGKDTLFIRGDEMNFPIVKGSIELDNFVELSENLWSINIPEAASYGVENIHQLFINGVRATRARTPNNGEMFRTGRVEEIVLDSVNSNSSGLAFQKLSFTNEQMDALKPAIDDLPNVFINVNHAWDRTRQYIKSVNTENLSVHIINQPMHVWNKLDKSSQFYLENSKAFLDQPGEWYLDKDGTLFYIPLESEDINNTTAEIAVVDQLLLINGSEKERVENIIFENISFQHTRHIITPNGERPNQAASNRSASVEINYSKNIQFNGCEISNVSNYAIWFKEKSNHCKLSQTYIHDLGMGGVKIGLTTKPIPNEDYTSHIIVDNNIIRSGGYEIPTGVGVIIFHSSDNTISHNDISDFRYTGVSVGWVWGYSKSVSKRNKIIYNHIHHLGWGELSDMGGVYTLGESEGTIVSNNVIHDIYSYGYGGWGLYTDEGSTGIIMENNLVYNCKSSGFHQHYGTNNIIRNNIFAFNIISQLQATKPEDHHSLDFTNNIIYFNAGDLFGMTRGANWHLINHLSENNCYWDTRTKDIKFNKHTFKQWQAQGKDKNSVIADPGFVNAEEYDFNFKRRNITRKIGFVPFDYSLAGVYGDKQWVDKAKLDQEKAETFKRIVSETTIHER